MFWPGEFHGLYSPWGDKELDTTERVSLSLSLSGKCRTKLHIVPLYITIVFKVDKLRLLVGVSVSNSQKVIE